MKYLVVWLCTGLLLPEDLPGQDMPQAVFPEKVSACTDREFYISGEPILFSARVFSLQVARTGNASRILYCELVNPLGEVVSRGKYELQQGTGNGCLQIPRETISGIYCLRLYTRLMRNGSPNDYNHIFLKIINATRTEVLGKMQAADEMTPEAEEPADKGNVLVSMGMTPSRELFKPGETVTITVNEPAGKGENSLYCLSVAPSEAFSGFVPAARANSVYTPGDTLEFLPETMGMVLSGRVLDKTSGKPLPNTLVNLSVIGDRDVMARNTDASGRFLFVLSSTTGNRDLFLSAGKSAVHIPEIYIDNDFCPKPIGIDFPDFSLNEGEKQLAFRMAVNQIITGKFNPLPETIPDSASKNAVAFYGKPTEVLVMEKYIDLPNMEEYFNELPVAVKVRKVQGKKIFRFNSTQAEMAIYEPLVLVDWVAVDDMEKVLGMSPRNILRIELVNSPYIKGNITYGGIVSFISKNSDFAGIDLPASGTFINYKFLSSCVPPGIQDELPKNIPDSRNTVYWNPDIKSDMTGKAVISFTTPATPGKYRIVLYRIDDTGNINRISKEIEVIP